MSSYREPKTTTMPKTNPDCQHCADNGVCQFISDTQRLIRDSHTKQSVVDVLIRAIQQQPTGVVLEAKTRRPMCANPAACNRRLPGTREQWLTRGK